MESIGYYSNKLFLINIKKKYFVFVFSLICFQITFWNKTGLIANQMISLNNLFFCGSKTLGKYNHKTR